MARLNNPGSRGSAGDGGLSAPGRVPSSDRRRYPLLALLVVFCGVYAGAPVADANYEAALLVAETHIEGEGAQQCGFEHHHLLCQLVRTLSLRGMASDHAQFYAASDLDPVTPTASARPIRPAPPGGSGPRAPPADRF